MSFHIISTEWLTRLVVQQAVISYIYLYWICIYTKWYSAFLDLPWNNHASHLTLTETPVSYFFLEFSHSLAIKYYADSKYPVVFPVVAHH